MATVRPTPAKSQLAAVKKAEAQRAAQQRAAQQRAAAQRAAAQQAAQERAQRAAQLQAVAQAQQRAAAQQAAQQRAQRAAQLQTVAQAQAQQQVAQQRAQMAATMTGGQQQIQGLGSFPGNLPPRDIGLGGPPPGFTGPRGSLPNTGNPFDREMPSMPAFPEQRVPENNAFFSSPEYRAFIDSTSGRPATMDMYNSPYFGDISSGSVGRAQDEAYRKYMGNNPQIGLPRDIGLGGPPPGFTGPRGLPSGAPPQQVEPFRPIEGMAGNLVGGFTPPAPLNQAGQLIGLGGQPQQRAQEAFDVTQGSSAYPPSFMPGQGVMNAGLGFGQAMGAPAVPQQSPTQAAFMQATQYNPRNQLNMSSNMQQPAQNQSTGFGQSNMFSNMQQPAPMQSNMNAGMGQNLSNAVGQTSANLFGGGPSASATQQQPQQQPGPTRTGGVF